MDPVDIIIPLVAAAAGAVTLYFWNKSVKTAKKRVEELELKWAEAKTQLLAVGKDPEKDNPFEELLDQARCTYSYEKHSFDQAAMWTSIVVAIIWLFGAYRISRG